MICPGGLLSRTTGGGTAEVLSSKGQTIFAVFIGDVWGNIHVPTTNIIFQTKSS